MHLMVLNMLAIHIREPRCTRLRLLSILPHHRVPVVMDEVIHLCYVAGHGVVLPLEHDYRRLGIWLQLGVQLLWPIHSRRISQRTSVALDDN